MPAKKVILSEAVILKLTRSGERHTQVDLISPDHGLFRVLKRNSKKANTYAIDLFDQGEAHIDHKTGEHANRGFLTEFVVSRKRSGIGKSYRSLQAASWLSGLLLRNPLHDDTSEDLFLLAVRAFDALDDGRPAHAVMLKTLFVFARDEGYPLIEDWANKLPLEIANAVAYLLKTPLADLEHEPRIQETAYQSLALYIEHHTHIQLP